MHEGFECRPGEHWYCLRAQVKKEHLAGEQIRRRVGIETYAPRIAFRKKTRRGVVRFCEALFPGYLFVRGEIRIHLRHLLAIPGVRGIVRYGPRIPDVPVDMLEALQAETGPDVCEIPDRAVGPGSEVVVVDGPFAEFRALVREVMPGTKRVALLLEFLGRELQVELPRESVMASAPRGGGCDADPD